MFLVTTVDIRLNRDLHRMFKEKYQRKKYVVSVKKSIDVQKHFEKDEIEYYFQYEKKKKKEPQYRYIFHVSDYIWR